MKDVSDYTERRRWGPLLHRNRELLLAILTILPIILTDCFLVRSERVVTLRAAARHCICMKMNHCQKGVEKQIIYGEESIHSSIGNGAY